MGANASLLPQPDERVVKCVEALRLGKGDLAGVYKQYQDADEMKKGVIPLSKLYTMIGERKSIFGDSIFELLGVKQCSHINFGEWLHAITTYCLFEELEILQFCFFVVDREKNGYVEMSELKMLVNMLYGTDPELGLSGNTRTVLAKLPVQADGKVEFWEFEQFHRSFPALFYPAFRLQVKMQQAVWGEDWWADRKRAIQDTREENRKIEEEKAQAEPRRIEKMRQRRIKKKMGYFRYHLWPCGREEFEKMYPKEVVIDKKKIEEELAAKKKEEQNIENAKKKRANDMAILHPETEEYKLYKQKKEQAAAAAAGIELGPSSSAGGLSTNMLALTNGEPGQSGTVLVTKPEEGAGLAPRHGPRTVIPVGTTFVSEKPISHAAVAASGGGAVIVAGVSADAEARRLRLEKRRAQGNSAGGATGRKLS